MFDLQSTLFVSLILCLLLACIFEFVNGFHDTANAVATVIYTNSLPSTQGVIWSGTVNFLGLLTGGVGVTMSIVGLLPVELLTDPNVYHTVAMSLAMLLAAILWNAGTWYFGLPSSSSHTLIGAILGIGFGYAMLPENRGSSENFVNWDKAAEIGKALLLSPLCGFTLAIVLMFFLKKTVRNKEIFKEPKRKSPPPGWIRALLITTCTLVSFFHGRNDGQKGIGLVMIVHIAFLPSFYAINDNVDPLVQEHDIIALKGVLSRVDTARLSLKDLDSFRKTTEAVRNLEETVTISLSRLSPAQKLNVRKNAPTIGKHGKKLWESENVQLSPEDRKILKNAIEGDSQPFISYGNRERGISSLSDFAPGWVMWMIALSLGIGTMIG